MLLIALLSGLGGGTKAYADEGAARPGAIELNPGPQLFIDDFLIAEQSFLTRTVNRPHKLPEPVVTGAAAGDMNFQPWLTVLHDPDTRMFRLWYNVPENLGTVNVYNQETRTKVGYMESGDGVHWIRPHRVLNDPVLKGAETQPIRFGAAVIDRGKGFVPKDERYAFAFWFHDGTQIAVSADGLDWHMLVGRTVIQHNNDISGLHWDPIRQNYLAIFAISSRDNGWGLTLPEVRRIPCESISKDLIHWEDKWPIIAPKIGSPIEEGETSFYSMSGVVARGGILVGLVKILRDDLNATPGATAGEMGEPNPKRKAAGLGYTVLAWSHDGRTWQRDDQPFLVNDPDPARWDHAMAWGADQLIVDDKTFIYYAGYKRGHKVARAEERQFGLATMPRDRYVSREADINLGRLVTKPLKLRGNKITVNAKTVGEMRVRLVDENFQPLEGFGWKKIQGDAVDLPVGWEHGLDTLDRRPVRIEFELRYAQLFGFDLASS